MNLELLNPFAQSFPENFETSIDANALCTRFNPRGTFAGNFLAVGRNDGVVAVLDFETRGIVRWFEGHVKAVTTVCWSKNSRYLLTASRDWNAIIWDLSSAASDTPEGERKYTVRFDAPVTSANLHPQNSKMLVVTLHAQVQPVFVDLRKNGGRWELKVEEEEEEEDEEDEDEAPKKREIATICRFNPRGDLIFVGTSRGNINIWDTQTKEFLWSENSGSNSGIKHMEFDRQGTSLVINSNDRQIRVIRLHATAPPEESSDEEEADAGDDEEEVEDGEREEAAKDDKMETEETIDTAEAKAEPVDEPAAPNPDAGSPIAVDEVKEATPTAEGSDANDEASSRAATPPPRPPRVPYFEVLHKFQDLVNRTPWNGCGFSRDGDLIIGGAGHKASHNVYIWDSDSGGLIKILEGPKDPLEDLDWHPLRPLIASVSSLGLIHIWVTSIAENWSAYAPGFEELDENREYQEREDEFDIEDESAKKRRKADEQDRPVDIFTVARDRSVSPPLILDDAFEAFASIEPDGDDDEAFYPPPYLLDEYDPDPVMPPQVFGNFKHEAGWEYPVAPGVNGNGNGTNAGGGGGGGGEEQREQSEELGLPNGVPMEEDTKVKRKKQKRG